MNAYSFFTLEKGNDFTSHKTYTTRLVLLRGLLVCFCFFLLNVVVHAQTKQRDLKDVVRDWLKKKDTTTHTEMIPREIYKSFLPVIGYSPANGFLIGAAVSVSSVLGDPANTLPSSAMLNLQITSKKQFIINARSAVYTPGNKWFSLGDWRWMIFTQPTYGLGITEGAKGEFSVHGISVAEPGVQQPMTFNYLRFYETVFRSLGKRWYAGGGLEIDYHYSIEDERLKLDSPQFLTHHYLYSKTQGFDSSKYVTSGLTMKLMYDTRDNLINAYRGSYLLLSYRINPEVFTHSRYSTMAFYEVKQFMSLSKRKPQHVLAFWSWGTFVTAGKVPYLALPSIGWDMYNRSGRGYVQGRLRGIDMMYGEVEYRFPITENGLFGGVVFGNITTASNLEKDLFKEFAPAGGIGLRIKMAKRSRTNITVDFGYGRESSAIYFNLQETF